MVSASSDVVSIKEMDCLIPLLIGQSHFPRGISARLSDWLGTKKGLGMRETFVGEGNISTAVSGEYN